MRQVKLPNGQTLVHHIPILPTSTTDLWCWHSFAESVIPCSPTTLACTHSLTKTAPTTYTRFRLTTTARSHAAYTN